MEKKTIKLITDEETLTVEVGHTKEEWDKLYGYDGGYWDFLIDELLDGSIEPCGNYVYWLICGRLYETNIDAVDYKKKKNEG